MNKNNKKAMHLYIAFKNEDKFKIKMRLGCL